METYQLKRIIIMTLVLVNLALLALLGQSARQDENARQQTLIYLKDLYLSSGIELSVEELPQAPAYPQATTLLSHEAAAAFSEAFLGDADMQESGSAMLYSSELGAMRLRRNGAFELNMYTPSLREDACLRLLEEFGYTAFFHRSGSAVYVTQTVDGVPIVGSTATLYFSGDHLSSASGFYVPALQEGEDSLSRSAADALAAFLQYAQQQSPVIRSVQSISPARQLFAETLFQSILHPAWILSTDQGVYSVNFDGSEITLLPSDLS